MDYVEQTYLDFEKQLYRLNKRIQKLVKKEIIPSELDETEKAIFKLELEHDIFKLISILTARKADSRHLTISPSKIKDIIAVAEDKTEKTKEKFLEGAPYAEALKDVLVFVRIYYKDYYQALIYVLLPTR